MRPPAPPKKPPQKNWGRPSRYIAFVVTLASAIGWIAGVGIGAKELIFGGIVIVAFMYAGLVFSTVSNTNKLETLGMVTAWVLAIIGLSSCTILFTAFFFGWPQAINSYF